MYLGTRAIVAATVEAALAIPGILMGPPLLVLFSVPFAFVSARYGLAVLRQQQSGWTSPRVMGLAAALVGGAGLAYALLFIVFALVVGGIE
jgi:hypothetical protein